MSVGIQCLLGMNISLNPCSLGFGLHFLGKSFLQKNYCKLFSGHVNNEDIILFFLVAFTGYEKFSSSSIYRLFLICAPNFVSYGNFSIYWHFF